MHKASVRSPRGSSLFFLWSNFVSISLSNFAMSVQAYSASATQISDSGSSSTWSFEASSRVLSMEAMATSDGMRGLQRQGSYRSSDEMESPGGLQQPDACHVEVHLSMLLRPFSAMRSSRICVQITAFKQ